MLWRGCQSIQVKSAFCSTQGVIQVPRSCCWATLFFSWSRGSAWIVDKWPCFFWMPFLLQRSGEFEKDKLRLIFVFRSHIFCFKFSPQNWLKWNCYIIFCVCFSWAGLKSLRRAVLSRGQCVLEHGVSVVKSVLFCDNRTCHLSLFLSVHEELVTSFFR